MQQGHEEQTEKKRERERWQRKNPGRLGFVLQWEEVGRHHSSSFMSMSEMVENGSNLSDIHL